MTKVMEMENRGRNEKGERERLVVIRERKEREAIQNLKESLKEKNLHTHTTHQRNENSRYAFFFSLSNFLFSVILGFLFVCLYSVTKRSATTRLLLRVSETVFLRTLFLSLGQPYGVLIRYLLEAVYATLLLFLTLLIVIY